MNAEWPLADAESARQLERFVAALASGDQENRVLHIHGPDLALGVLLARWLGRPGIPFSALQSELEMDPDPGIVLGFEEIRLPGGGTLHVAVDDLLAVEDMAKLTALIAPLECEMKSPSWLAVVDGPPRLALPEEVKDIAPVVILRGRKPDFAG